MNLTTEAAKVEQAKAWDGGEGGHWTDYEDRYNDAVARYDGHLVKGARTCSNDSVLDIGCGWAVQPGSRPRRQFGRSAWTYRRMRESPGRSR
jgi:hypothetical protein